MDTIKQQFLTELWIGNQQITEPEKLYNILSKHNITYLIFKNRYISYGNSPKKLFAHYKVKNGNFLAKHDQWVPRKKYMEYYHISISALERYYYIYGPDLKQFLDYHRLTHKSKMMWANSHFFKPFNAYMKTHYLSGQHNENDNYKQLWLKRLKDDNIINTKDYENPFESFKKQSNNPAMQINGKETIASTHYINYKERKYLERKNRFLSNGFSINRKTFHSIKEAADTFKLSPNIIEQTLMDQYCKGRLIYAENHLYTSVAAYAKIKGIPNATANKRWNVGGEITKPRLKRRGKRKKQVPLVLATLKNKVNEYKKYNKCFTITEFSKITGISSTYFYTLLNHYNKIKIHYQVIEDVLNCGWITKGDSEGQQWDVRPEAVEYVLLTHEEQMKKANLVMIPFTNSRYMININNLRLYDLNNISLIKDNGQSTNSQGTYRLAYDNIHTSKKSTRYIVFSVAEMKSIIAHPDLTYKDLYTKKQIEATYSKAVIKDIVVANLPKYTRHDEKGNSYKGYYKKDIQKLALKYK